MRLSSSFACLALLAPAAAAFAGEPPAYRPFEPPVYVPVARPACVCGAVCVCKSGVCPGGCPVVVAPQVSPFGPDYEWRDLPGVGPGWVHRNVTVTTRTTTTTTATVPAPQFPGGIPFGVTFPGFGGSGGCVGGNCPRGR